MIKIISLILLILPWQSHADVIEVISDKYIQGPHLIYDCVDQHWVCVEEEAYANCEREIDFNKNYPRPKMMCLKYNKSYKTYAECVLEQKKVILDQLSKWDCYSPQLRGHFIEFE